MARYIKNGNFLILKNILPIKDVSATRDYVENTVRDMAANKFAHLQNPFYGDALWEELDYNKIDNDLQHIYRGEAPLSVRTSEEVMGLGLDPGLVHEVKKLMGTTKIGMHTPPSVRVVRPNSKLCAVPAHVDQIYNSHITNFLTVWVPLKKITQEMPGMAIKTADDPRYRELGNFELQDRWFCPKFSDLDSFEPIYIEPGDALVFEDWVVHKSLPNVSNDLRLSIDFRYFPLELGSKKRFMSLENV